MKTYVKSNNTLHSGNKATLKVYSSLPANLSGIVNEEVILLENVGFYQKENDSLVPLFDPNHLAVSDGAVGDIIAYYGSTNPDPDNFVVCNGGTFSSTTFPALYSLLGTNTTPNLTGYHLKGTGNNATWSSHDAITLKSKVAANYPNHTHTVSNPQHSHSASGGSHYHRVCANCYLGNFNNCRYGCCGTCIATFACCMCISSAGMYTNAVTPSSLGFWTNGLGTVTIGCPSTASGYNAVRYGSETKCKDKTVLFLMRAK